MSLNYRSIDAWIASNTMNPRIVAGETMTGKPVAKRLVFHIGGYDPITSDVSAQRRFVGEIARLQRTWTVKTAVDRLHDTADQMQSNATTTGPEWPVATDY